jgi:hypothetical protein
MKHILSTLAIIILWCSLSSSGCGESGGGGGVQTVAPGTGGGGTGVGGSTARFTIAKNCLYAIHNDSLKVFSIQTNRLNITNQISVGRSIETIYPFENSLYIAGPIGMVAYDITNPISPLYQGYVQHVTGCDPVVANATHVYLTIHGGTNCRSSNINELQIYKLGTTFNKSVLLAKVQMTSPLGLGLKNNRLYVCDRGVGIKVFDISTPANTSQNHFINLPIAKDVIPYNNLLVCNTESGVAYYDISNPNQSNFLSSIN